MSVLHAWLQGLYAGLEGIRSSGTSALVVAREGRVLDFCSRAQGRGVVSGMPIGHAHQCIPDASVVEFDADLYRPDDLEFLPRLGAAVSPQVEVVEPEQIFVQLGAREDGRAAARRLVRAAADGPGHTLWVGVAVNRLLARIATLGMEDDRFRGVVLSSSDPRAELLAISGDAGEKFIRSLPVSYLWPLPQEVRGRLERLGLKTVGEVAEISEGILAHQFDAVTARCLHNYSRGRDASVVSSDYPLPEIAWEREIHLASSGAMWQVLSGAARYLADELSAEGLGGLTVSLELWADDGRHREERNLSRPVRRSSALQQILCRLGEGIARRSAAVTGSPVRMRAVVSSLMAQRIVQESIFSAAERSDQKEVRKLVSDLNDKYTDRIIFWGEQLPVTYREKRLAFWDPIRGER